MGKITLTNIAEELAAKSGLGKEAADRFVRAFVSTLEEGLRADGIAKVKGLGTFKLLQVSDRDSVNVSTGERITIKGYTKVSFTPDSAIRELINRPFAHFEPTELNEGYPEEEEQTLLDGGVETCEENDVVETQNAEAVVEDTVAVEEVAEVVPEVKEVTEEPSVEEDAAEVLPDEENTEEVLPVAEDIELVAEDKEKVSPVEEEKSAPVEKKQNKRRGCGGCMVTLLVILLILVAAGIGFLNLDKLGLGSAGTVVEHTDIVVNPNLEEEFGAEWGDEPKVQEVSSVKKQPESVTLPTPPQEVVEKKGETSAVATEKAKPVEVVQTAKPATETPFCAVEITESLQKKEIKDVTPADTTDYIMDGTLVEHKLKSGETIISLAKKYYGDKRLWPYIVMYNNMKDFNKVAIGQKIKVPVLKKKTIE